MTATEIIAQIETLPQIERAHVVEYVRRVTLEGSADVVSGTGIR